MSAALTVPIIIMNPMTPEVSPRWDGGTLSGMRPLNEPPAKLFAAWTRTSMPAYHA